MPRALIVKNVAGSRNLIKKSIKVRAHSQKHGVSFVDKGVSNVDSSLCEVVFRENHSRNSECVFAYGGIFVTQGATADGPCTSSGMG
jgi:hypothetical protein